MSSAHRPTWDPAAAKKQIATRIYSSRDIAAHTRLKFRQPGQQSTSDVQRRDLKLELLEAERIAAEKKAKGETVLGSAPAGLIEQGGKTAAAPANDEEEPEAKRRRLLQQAREEGAEDADDVDDEEGTAATNGVSKGKGKAVDDGNHDDAPATANANDDEDEDDDDDDDDDDEDETAELLRELEKIKRERAEEKERQERERAATDAVSREEEIAMANPLLNLQAALGGNASPSPSLSSTSSFGVKRRWDEDVIFKNQAQKDDKPTNEFVNDLVRTNFHKRFLKKFIA